jgi:hypothetical protein
MPFIFSAAEHVQGSKTPPRPLLPRRVLTRKLHQRKSFQHNLQRRRLLPHKIYKLRVRPRRMLRVRRRVPAPLPRRRPLPNFRPVTAGEVVPPETMRQKLVKATEDNFDYTSLFFAGVIAADSFVTKATPEFHQGAAGYARYYWHTVADQAIENYFVELIVSGRDARGLALLRDG